MYLGIYRILLPTLAWTVLLAAAPLRAQVTAAVAANVQFAMEDLRADFRKASGIEVKAVYASSGKLCAQIRHGAPFDIFVSADMEFPDSLSAWGHASGKPKPYAYGRLVLWTVKPIDLSKGLSLLADSGLGKIALADPKRAPYGREAVKAMRYSGTWATAEPRLIFGESIAQVNQYILLGTVDIGFTAKSIVLAADMRGRGTWMEVDSAAYDPIAQGAVVTRYGQEQHPVLAVRFLDYLQSPPARAILSRYGYRLP